MLAGPWEIPRTNILFEENNQDGKFGVLVRAKLCEGFNQNVQAPVTVKIARSKNLKIIITRQIPVLQTFMLIII